MIKFEKVSYKQFVKDCLNVGYTGDIQKAYDSIKLPCRSSSGSAGYDFYSPIEFDLIKSSRDESEVQTFTVPTGVRCTMDSDKVLMLYPRSGIGFKTGMYLANTVGVIDSDYYFAKNEGHIMAKVVRGFDDITFSYGDRIMQGVFVKYYTTDDDNTTDSRTGGFGSSGK